MLAARIPAQLRNDFKSKAAKRGLSVAEAVQLLVQNWVDED